MDDFYVYSWSRPDTCEIFYIGKGRGKRDVSLKRYNPIFMNIVAKLRKIGLEPKIERLADSLCESDAFEIERNYILKIGRIDKGTGPLANLTDGGEGSSGAVPTIETRVAIGNASRRAIRTVEWRKNMGLGLIGNKNALGITRSDETRAKMSLGQKKAAENRVIPDCMRSIISVKSKVANRRMPPKASNTSGYKGVSYSKDRRKWQAYITIDKKRVPLGRFDSAEDAARAYDDYAKASIGDDCYLNFPLN